jgi:transcriptional regulator with XRE-family HTH domain
MKDILQKIKDIRTSKGFSYENMADELEISTSAYRKIENNETKLTVERLFQISKILKTPVNDILGSKLSNVFYQNNNDTGTFNSSYQDIETYYHQENRETTQELINMLKQESEHLKDEIAFLREIIQNSKIWKSHIS